MPNTSTTAKAKSDRRRGKKASTQAGNFVREEIDEIRAGKHGAANAKQAIAIGLSKARRAGVKVKDNPNRKKAKGSKKKAARKPSAASSAKRSRAATRALKKKPRAAASSRALSRHAKAVARRKK